jgi:ABC-type antimicrobial peptide transport system permease subunit
MKPIKGLKKEFQVGKSAKYLKQASVIFQVILSGFLLTTSSGIDKQMDFISEKDLGIDINNVIQIKTTPLIKEHFQSLKNDLLQDPAIHNVSASEMSICNISTVIGSSWDFKGRDKNKVLEVHLNKVTADFANTFGIKLREGRFFSSENLSDKENAVVLNQTAVELMGLEDPLGKRFSFWGWDMDIIGIIDDFHLESMDNKINPLVIINRIRPSQMYYIYVKIDSQNLQGVLTRIQSVLHNIDPTSEPNHSFLEDQYSQMYKEENQFEGLMSISSLLAISIACIGLFGMVSFIAESKHREIGIRKILGASIIQVSGNVVTEVIILTIIGVLLSTPFSIMVINNWLKTFAYHAEIGFSIYIQTLGIVIFVVFFSIIYPVLKAATSNPVDTLRRE